MSRGAEFPRKIGVMIRPNKRKVMHKVVGVGANPGIINKSSIEAFKIAMWSCGPLLLLHQMKGVLTNPKSWEFDVKINPGSPPGYLDWSQTSHHIFQRD